MVDIDGMPIAEVIYAYSATNVFLKYGWVVSCKDNNAALEFELLKVEKYWKYAAQVMDKLNNLQDFILALVIFVQKTQANYNGKMQWDKQMRFRQDIDHN